MIKKSLSLIEAIISKTSLLKFMLFIGEFQESDLTAAQIPGHLSVILSMLALKF